MEITKSQAEVWRYKAVKKDSPIDGKFLGWMTRRPSYQHYKCGRYFTEFEERHDCRHWSITFLKKMASEHLERD